MRSCPRGNDYIVSGPLLLPQHCHSFNALWITELRQVKKVIQGTLTCLKVNRQGGRCHSSQRQMWLAERNNSIVRPEWLTPRLNGRSACTFQTSARCFLSGPHAIGVIRYDPASEGHPRYCGRIGSCQNTRRRCAHAGDGRHRSVDAAHRPSEGATYTRCAALLI